MVIFAHRAIELPNLYYFSLNRILHHIDDASVSREQIFPVTKRFLLDVAHHSSIEALQASSRLLPILEVILPR